jgi:hypothetical protein
MSEHDNWFPGLWKDLTAAFVCRQDIVRSPAPRKTRLSTVVTCVMAITLSATTPALASGSSDPASVLVDVLVARPISFAVTTVGSALFVVSLPFAAASRSTHETAETLVVGPARDLFTRPVGDLDDFLSY